VCKGHVREIALKTPTTGSALDQTLQLATTMAISWVSTPAICEGPWGGLPITEWWGSFLDVEYRMKFPLWGEDLDLTHFGKPLARERAQSGSSQTPSFRLHAFCYYDFISLRQASLNGLSKSIS
jgi:hypothetical protein